MKKSLAFLPAIAVALGLLSSVTVSAADASVNISIGADGKPVTPPWKIMAGAMI